jgi:Pyridoxamine 5'-phosphate oxidase
MTTTTSVLPNTTSDSEIAQTRRITKVLSRRSFCVLATTSPSGNSHAAGVMFEWADAAMYVHTMRSSRKARNVTANPSVGIVVPTRRLPVGPPFNVQFQATATLMPMDDPMIPTLLANKHLRKISGHGALTEPDGCFLRIVPQRAVHTYGIGVPISGIIKDPLHAGARATPWNHV